MDRNSILKLISSCSQELFKYLLYHAYFFLYSRNASCVNQGARENFRRSQFTFLWSYHISKCLYRFVIADTQQQAYTTYLPRLISHFYEISNDNYCFFLSDIRTSAILFPSKQIEIAEQSSIVYKPHWYLKIEYWRPDYTSGPSINQLHVKINKTWSRWLMKVSLGEFILSVTFICPSPYWTRQQ